MGFYYSNNINVQLIVALLKEHGIKKVIASPGTTNLELMASFQHDEWFEMYSCVDERSAAYMACGLAEESGEAVVITCTEATASRNYYSGMTEAYHRKLPILAITGLHNYTYIGNLEPQVIDRSVSPLDSMKLKVNLPIIKCEQDIQESEFLINEAILELWHNGDGPVHINMPWGGGDFDFSIQELPKVHKIERVMINDKFPTLKADKIAILIGTHKKWSQEQEKMIENFCEKYNAVVFCDHTSKYYGKYRIQPALMTMQQIKYEALQNIELLIHIGEETGDDRSARIIGKAKHVWRISKDGKIRITFGKLNYIFEMPEEQFFAYYGNNAKSNNINTKYYTELEKITTRLQDNIPELPFSNIYVASKISKNLPANSIIHFGVSDTIRAWTLFELPKTVQSSCNSGCRGIDGCVSALVGASLAEPKKIHFGVVGDLTFFYDMNVLGNRSISNNLRLIVVNNDGGNIFRHNGHASQTWLGFEKANMYIAAGGHFGAKSHVLLKHYAEDLGFYYLSASNKNEFDNIYKKFISPDLTDKPVIFEVFTDAHDDSNAFDIISKIEMDSKGQAKDAIKNIIGERGVSFMKKVIKGQ